MLIFEIENILAAIGLSRREEVGREGEKGTKARRRVNKVSEGKSLNFLLSFGLIVHE